MQKPCNVSPSFGCNATLPLREAGHFKLCARVLQGLGVVFLLVFLVFFLILLNCGAALLVSIHQLFWDPLQTPQTLQSSRVMEDLAAQVALGWFLPVAPRFHLS